MKPGNIGLECSHHHDVTMPLLIDITPTPIAPAVTGQRRGLKMAPEEDYDTTGGVDGIDDTSSYG